MEVKISDIKVKSRIREDIGDLKPLMDSLNKHGQFHPLTITDKYELISGFRRLTAAKALSWEFIEVKIVHVKNKIDFLERELDENLLRKEFTPDEITTGYIKLQKLQNPNLLIRIFRAIKNFFKSLFKKKTD